MQKTSRVWSVVRVSSGNFLEMYDFMVFGYYASAIAGGFFPGGSPFVSTYLIQTTGNRAVPGLWPSFAAGCSLIAAVLAQPYLSAEVQAPDLDRVLRLQEHA